MLLDVRHCPNHRTCRCIHTTDDGEMWCFEDCKQEHAPQKSHAVRVDLDKLFSMLSSEKYHNADTELKATWNKAIKKAVLMVESSILKD